MSYTQKALAAASALLLGVPTAVLAQPGVLPPGYIGRVTGNTPNTWQTYTYTYTPSTSGANFVGFAFRQDPAFWSFDNAALYAPGSNTNLFTNGSFTTGGSFSITTNNGPSNIQAPNSWGVWYQDGTYPAAAGTWTNGMWYDGAVGTFDGIYQGVNLDAGTQYTISFSVSGNHTANTSSVQLGTYAGLCQNTTLAPSSCTIPSSYGFTTLATPAQGAAAGAPAVTVTGTSTTNQVTTSSSSSTRTETSYVTRNVSSTDADGNPVVSTYTDTITTTIPVTTTTTTTTPVTTTTYSDGTSTSTNGTPVVTTSSVDGTRTSAVTSTSLDSTAVTAPVTTTSSSVSNTTATRTVTRVVNTVDADGNPVARTYTDTILDTTPVTTVVTTVTPTTTTTLANGSTSVTPGNGTSSSASTNGQTTSSVVSTSLDSTAVTRTVTSSSTATSATTATRTVRRTVTDTDAAGNPRVRSYTDTILDTTPVITTTTTSTPVTTTYNADGSTAVAQGTSSSSSSSVNGTVSSSVIATALDATAITRPSAVFSSAQSTTLPVLRVTQTDHTASEDKGVQKIARHYETTTVTPMVTTIVTTPVTTTSYSNGTETVSNGSPSTAYQLWNNVTISHAYDALFGRIDQLEVLDNMSNAINGLLNHEPSRTKERLRVFENNRFIQSYNGDGYSADSKVFGGGFEFDVTKGWTVGYQYNNVNINLRGVDSNASQVKNVHGIFNVFDGNTFSLNTNAAIADSKYNYSRTVEGVFNNTGSTTGNEWWVSNRLYMHVTKWLHPFFGYTVSNVRRNAYNETGSIQSARSVAEFNQTTHVGEAGVKLETRFGGKKHDLFGISVDGSYGTDNSYGVTGSLDYKEVLFVEGSYGVADGVTTNSVAGKVKFRF